jgi:AraC-like DNA-binding protein
MATHDDVYPLFDSLINRLRPEILRHGLTSGDASWNYPKTLSPYNRLYFFLGGKASVGYGGEWTELQVGQIYLLPLNKQYHLKATQAFKKFFIHFRLELWPGRDIFEGPLDAPPLVMRPKLSSFAETVTDYAAEGTASAYLLFQSKLFEVIETFLSKYEFKPSGELASEFLLAEKYRSVFEMAESTPFREWSMNDLAVRLKRSLPSLSRSFKRDTGMTLGDFFRMRLLRRAQDRLLLSDLSVRELAAELGFEDEHYFSRWFKKLTERSPKAYRLENKMILMPG